MPWWTGDIGELSGEEFHGYFGDIRSVAIRTLPRRPPRELLALLNTGVHGFAENGNELVLASPNKQSNVFKANPAYSFYDFDWDLPVAQSTGEYSFQPTVSNQSSDRGKKKKPGGRCSQVEKTMLAISGYLAIAILVLIIVVGVLVVSLRSLDNNIDELKNVSIIVDGYTILAYRNYVY